MRSCFLMNPAAYRKTQRPMLVTSKASRFANSRMSSTAIPLLLNVKNGTIDLRTGELLQHRREDFLTKMVPIKYDEKAACPKFSRFLNETLPDAGLVGYLSRFAGYCLTGLTSEQAWFMFYGVTASGKSTLINVLRGLLGPYALALPEHYFLAAKNTSDYATAN